MVKSVPFSLLLAENINPSENPFTHDSFTSRKRISRPSEYDVLNMTKSYDLNDVQQKAHTDENITANKISRFYFVRKKILEALRRLTSFKEDNDCSSRKNMKNEYHEIIKYIKSYIINQLIMLYDKPKDADNPVKIAKFFL